MWEYLFLLRNRIRAYNSVNGITRFQYCAPNKWTEIDFPAKRNHFPRFPALPILHLPGASGASLPPPDPYTTIPSFCSPSFPLRRYVAGPSRIYYRGRTARGKQFCVSNKFLKYRRYFNTAKKVNTRCLEILL